jgi:hypothetical protein
LRSVAEAGTRHNKGVPELTCRTLAASATIVLSIIAVAGCTASGDTGQRLASDAHAATSAAPTPTPTTPAVEPGTTQPGSRLALGQPAVVRFATNAAHDSLIKLTVDAVRRGKFTDLQQFRLSDSARNSGLFYVSANVTNTGDGDLGGQTLRLYGKVAPGLVVSPVSLGTTFRPCANQPLPSSFVFGDRAKVCLVYFAPRHGTVRAVQWRPTYDVKPITWQARH